MEVSASVHDAAVWVAIGFLGFGAVMIAERKRAPRALLPAGIAFIAIAALTTIWSLGAQEQIEVRERDGVMTARRTFALEIGSFRWSGSAPTRVVNESSKPLQILELTYETSIPLLPDDMTTRVAEIPPHTVYEFGRSIEWVGPDRVPPREIESRDPVTKRYWLTWE